MTCQNIHVACSLRDWMWTAHECSSCGQSCRFSLFSCQQPFDSAACHSARMWTVARTDVTMVFASFLFYKFHGCGSIRRLAVIPQLPLHEPAQPLAPLVCSGGSRKQKPLHNLPLKWSCQSAHTDVLTSGNLLTFFLTSSDILTDISCDISSDILSDIYLVTFFLSTYLLTFFLTYLPTFFLTYLLTFCLTFFLTFFLAFFLTFFLAFCLRHLLTFCPTCLLTCFLTYRQTSYLTFFLTFCLSYLLTFCLTF